VKFASIGSGSEGNGTLICSGDGDVILLDCGFSGREAVKRLATLNLGLEDISAILVTHEHSDHVKGVALLANKGRIPVYCTWGTWAAKLHTVLDESLLTVISPHQRFSIGNILVQPVPVPHDAREPCQFIFESSGQRLGILTDVGSITPHMVEQYQRCDALMLECNHDLNMLAESAYPPSLKRRVAGPLGHLNNQQAAEMLGQLDCSRLQHLVATHISQKNNHPELAMQALRGVVGFSPDRIRIAKQCSGFAWLEIEVRTVACGKQTITN